MKDKRPWKVRSFGVTICPDGSRRERPFEDYTEEEQKEIGRRMTEKVARLVNTEPLPVAR